MRKITTLQLKRLLGIVAAAIAFTFVSISSSVATESVCDKEDLKALHETVVAQYPGWYLVTPSKLSDDDRIIWGRNWKGACPGIARGDFDGSGLKQYAVLIISKSSKQVKGQVAPIRRMRLLHVVSENGYEFRTLEEAQTALIPVVYRSPPGKYEYFKPASDIQLTTNVKTDVIVLEVLEASSIAYILRNGKVSKLTLSF